MVNVPSWLSAIPTIALVWLHVDSDWITCCRLLALPRKRLSPPYCAATVFVPTGSANVLALAPRGRKAVCSPVGAPQEGPVPAILRRHRVCAHRQRQCAGVGASANQHIRAERRPIEIGRASCRERV